MNDILFRILVLILVLAALSVSIYYRRRAERTGGDKIDRTKEGVPLMLVLRLAGLGVWGGMLVYVINPDWLAFAALPLPAGVRWFGFVLALIGLPLMVWMFRSLGNNITDTVQTRENAQLVTRGPYRYIRHPLYSFGALFFVGLMLMTANALNLVCGVIALSLLVLRTPAEEERLVAKFGDTYRNYMAQTGRFLPKLSR